MSTMRVTAAMKWRVACLAITVAAGMCGTGAEAQTGRRTYAAGPQAPGNPGGLPFSSVYRRPTISPYNQLSNFAMNPMQNQNVYQQMVLPLVQQQQQQIEQLQQARRLNAMQNQVQQIQRDTSARQIDESIRPTGHRATFMNYSHFYGPR